jgi:hypothetical protein
VVSIDMHGVFFSRFPLSRITRSSSSPRRVVGRGRDRVSHSRVVCGGWSGARGGALLASLSRGVVVNRADGFESPT